jgi:hypothetical protein
MPSPLKSFRFLPSVAVAVVFLPRFRTAQHFMRFVQLLELLLHLSFSRASMQVRMVLAGEPTIGFFNLVGRGCSLES